MTFVRPTQQVAQKSRVWNSERWLHAVETLEEGVARIHTQLEVVRRHLLEAEDKLEEASGDWTPWVHIRTVKQDCADMRLKVTDLAGQAKAIIELQRHRTQEPSLGATARGNVVDVRVWQGHPHVFCVCAPVVR